jgi:methenyltetrahydromethanopterin cyclohydrolase
MNISINQISSKLVKNLLDNADKLNLKVKEGALNCTIIDAGINTPGSIEAGILISEICLGGLGNVTITPSNFFDDSTIMQISVHSAHPVIACLGSQYAGWSLSSEGFFSLGSGPVRSIAQKEEIFNILKYTDDYEKTITILEVDKEPPKEIVQKVSEDSKIRPQNLVFILTPTTSVSGNIQVVARVLEVAIHKVHELGFPLDRIESGFGTAPLPPIGKNFVSAMGRTNDSIIYGGNVQLVINGPEDDLINLAKELPSSNSKDYGKTFKKIFEEYNQDFYKIDGSLFSPARVIINSKESGKIYKSGDINKKIIKNSFES